MAIKRHSFRKVRIDSHFNWTAGVLLWLLFSFTFYCFLILFKDVFRSLSSGVSFFQYPLILTDAEHFKTNLFFAGISASIGFNFAMRFVLQNPLKRMNWYTRFRSRIVLTYEGFWTWLFLATFGKFSETLFFLNTNLALHFELFYWKDLQYLLLPLPIFLFYATWPSFSSMIIGKKLKWFVGLTFSYLLLCLALSFINLTDKSTIDDILVRNFFAHYEEEKKPQARSHFERHFLCGIDIFLLKDSLDSNNFNVVVNDSGYHHKGDTISGNNLENALMNSYLRWKEFDCNISLFIDKNIQMREVNSLIHSINKKTSVKHHVFLKKKRTRPVNKYPPYILMDVPASPVLIYRPELIQFLDSAIDRAEGDYEFGLMEDPIYKKADFSAYKQLKVSLSNTGITLEGNHMDSVMFRKQLHVLIQKHSAYYIIDLKVAPNTTFANYGTLLKLIKKQINKTRNEVALEKHGEPYVPKIKKRWHYSLEREYPNIKIEWTADEKRIHEEWVKSQKE